MSDAQAHGLLSEPVPAIIIANILSLKSVGKDFSRTFGGGRVITGMT